MIFEKIKNSDWVQRLSRPESSREVRSSGNDPVIATPLLFSEKGTHILLCSADDSWSIGS